MIVRRPSSHAKPLRPPGAVHESELGGLCIRCGNCLAACPSNIIRPDSGKSALTRLFTPTLQFDKDYCHEDCTACTQACPSGALIHVPQEKKATTRIGLPRVDMNLCLLGEDRECAECRNRCPYEAIRYVFSEEQYCLTPQIDESRCNGCGACEAACPVRPVRAIIVSPID